MEMQCLYYNLSILKKLRLEIVKVSGNNNNFSEIEIV